MNLGIRDRSVSLSSSHVKYTDCSMNSDIVITLYYSILFHIIVGCLGIMSFTFSTSLCKKYEKLSRTFGSARFVCCHGVFVRFPVFLSISHE